MCSCWRLSSALGRWRNSISTKPDDAVHRPPSPFGPAGRRFGIPVGTDNTVGPWFAVTGAVLSHLLVCNDAMFALKFKHYGFRGEVRYILRYALLSLAIWHIVAIPFLVAYVAVSLAVRTRLFMIVIITALPLAGRSSGRMISGKQIQACRCGVRNAFCPVGCGAGLGGFSNRNNALGTVATSRTHQIGRLVDDRQQCSQQRPTVRKTENPQTAGVLFLDDSMAGAFHFVWHPDLKYNEVKQSCR